jgi:hypothetical protein
MPRPFDDVAFRAFLDDTLPVQHTVGATLRQQHDARIGIDVFQEHFDFVADVELFNIIPLFGRDDALAFESNIQQHFVLADADHAAFQNPLDINMPNGFTQLTFECGVGVAAIKFGGQCGFDVCIRDVNVADQRAIYHVFVLFPSDDPPANAPWT